MKRVIAQDSEDHTRSVNPGAEDQGADWKGKRVLVTGGAGFLGSHLCESLLDDGVSVLCVDNFFTGSNTNIAHLMPNPNFEFLSHDICNPLDVEVDEIYNLACPASPVAYQRDPVKTVKTNVCGALNILDLARELDAKVLQASTSEVYGNPEVHPQEENYWGHVNPIGPRACYDEGKRCAETLFFDYHRQYGVKIKVARIFNTYGPRMDVADGRVVSNFIVSALKGDPITIYGDGSQTRSFCFVADLIRGLRALMDCPESITGPVNLGTPYEVTIGELAERVVSRSGSNSPIDYRDLPTDDPVRRRPNIDKARDLLRWEPKTPLDEGIDLTSRYFEALLNLPESVVENKLGNVVEMV